MKKTIKTIVAVVITSILLCSAYILGTTQAKTVEVVPDGYMSLNECIPLEDIACCFINSNDYLCFELKDVWNQLDNPNNESYKNIMQHLENTTEDYNNTLVDMRKVRDFKVTENGLQLYTADGNSYYWEK